MSSLAYTSCGCDQIICNGDIVTIGQTAVTGYTYSWTANSGGFTSTSAQPAVSPTSNKTYYLTVANASGCTKLDTVKVYVNPKPAKDAGPDRNVCANNTSTTIGNSVVAGRTYSWTSSPAGFTSSSANPSVSPSVTTTYYLYEVNNYTGCFEYDTVIVNVNAVPGKYLAGVDKSICFGSSASIGATAVTGNTYTWTSNPSGFTSTSANPTITPSTTTTYYLNMSNVAGCTNADTVIVTVNPLPGKNAGVDKTICINTSTTIGATASTGNTYAWTSSPSGYTSTSANPTVNPTTTTNYYLVETTLSGCKNYDTVIVNVNGIGAAGTISGNTSLCPGTTSTYSISSVSCATTYTWTVPTGWTINSGQGTTSISVTAGTTSGSIGVTPSSGSYAGTASTKTITIFSVPNKNAGVDKTICLGSSTSIGATATTGNTYAWTSSPSGYTSTAANPSVNPSTTTTYYLVENNANGCSNKDTVIVTVNPIPGKNAGSDKTMCQYSGIKIGATATTGNTYAWSSSPSGYSSTLANPTVSPNANTTYYLVETNASGCKNYDTVIVTVNPAPGKNAGVDKTVCLGSSTTIGATATANRTYAWSSSTSGSVSTLANPSVSPTTTTTYYLVETNSNTGCQNYDTAIVNVNPVPNKDGGIDKTMCQYSGAQIGLASTTGRTYAWSSSPSGYSSTLANPVVSPNVTTNYYLTETITATGCSTTDTVVVNVNPAPGKNAGADKAVCAGSSTSIGATSATNRTYAWTSSPSGFVSTAANPTVTPSATTTYYLVETNSTTGCQNYDTAIVTVNPLPSKDGGVDKTICQYSAAVIGATSTTGRTYAWTSSPSGFTSTSSKPTVSPNLTTTYYLTETNTTTGCAQTDTVIVNVNPAPGKNAGADKAVCLGSSTSIGVTSSINRTYAWTSNPTGFTSTSANPKVTPTATTTYYLVETNATTGCQNYDTAIVVVNPLPSANAGIDQTITGTTATLAGNNPGTGYTGLWTVVSGTGTFSNSTAYNSSVSNVKKCSSVYLWTVTNTTTGCKASDDVMINVDNKAVYTYSQWNSKDTLKPGVVIATPIDVDTAIISAAVKSGYSLPNGFALNSTNGKIYVYDSSLVKPGYYCLNVITTDACNRPSDISACFTVRKDKESVPNKPTTVVKAASCFNLYDVLANFSDSDGTIYKSYVSAGQLPNGLSLTNAGVLSVTNLTALQAQGGHFLFTIRTVDITGGSTLTKFDITIYKEYQAYYVVNSFSANHNFTLGEVVAYPVDSNGIITSASITSGSLPPGIGFNTSHGKFTVISLSALTGGTWTLGVKTHDNYCGISNNNVTINFSSPLPVQWLSFTAEASGNNTSTLNWSTATELNNSHFEIERSFNGLSWNKVGQVKGNGTSNVINNYNKIDVIPSSWTGSVVYYRIKQVDYNGQFEYSKTEKVSFVREASSIKVWYNMNETKFMVKYTSDKDQMIQIALTDMASGQLKVISAHVTPGVNNFTLEAATIAAGMYNVIISSGNDDVKSFKVIKY